MLEEVRITGLGVIDDAMLELSPGFTVVTGETGAGKTMVVTGLGLLFGGRADPARVRPGAQRAVVEGRLTIAPDSKVARQVDEAGGELDDDGAALVINRSVSAEGRSRAHAGGRSVPGSLLTSLAAHPGAGAGPPGPSGPSGPSRPATGSPRRRPCARR